MATHVPLMTNVALTNAQRMLWTAEQLSGDTPIYSMAFAFVIHAELDPVRFERSLRVVLGEADTMRMVVEENDSEPVITLLPDVDFNLEILDLTDAPEPREAFLSWATSRTNHPIDLTREPFTTALVELGPHTTGWYFRQHHLFADALGFSILFRRLSQVYQSIGHGGLPDGEPLQSFTELALQTPAVTKPQAQETTEPVSLYGWRGDPTSTASTRIELDLGIERTASLRGLLDRPGWQGLTRDLGMFRILSTALFAYLQRVSGAESITIGVPVHNRPTARHRRAPGLFTEVFPITLKLSGEETFETIQRQIVVETDRLLRASGAELSSGTINRNLNVVLNYLPMTFGDFDGAEVESRWIHSGHTEADHQLRLHVTDFDSSGSLGLLFDCNDDVLPAGRRERAVGHFLTLLDAMITNPETLISSVGLVLPDERRQVLAHAAGPSRLVKGTVLDRFADQVERHPSSVAVVEGGRTWTYGELAERSTEAAKGLPGSSVIGVCLPRSADAVLTMLAVLKSGSAYVPIDPSWPTDRIDFVIRDAGCALVVGERPEASGSEVGFTQIDGLTETETPLDTVTGDDIAYVLYTSGSTGAPKGVVVDHSSLANYVSWAGDFYGEGLAFPLFSPLTFDLTITSIFVPLCTGGSIRVYPETGPGFDLSVREVFQEDEVDIVKLTPSHLSLLTDVDLRSSRVSQLILGGEDLTVSLADRAHGWFGGDIEIHNEYGPTEATVGCIIHTFDPAGDRSGSVPVGRPIQNMTALVLGESREVLPFGVAGRLWVGGASVSQGYLNRQELTSERFCVLPEPGHSVFYDTGDLARMREDGTIEYLGRSDDQVKVLGARVELGEVEAAVASHPDVLSAVATVFTREVRFETEPGLSCLRCGLPDNYPGIVFDASGICNRCRSFEDYRGQVDSYFKSMLDLQETLDKAKRVTRSQYDCIALLSGGKDSTYALARIVDMGAEPLAFTLDNGYISEEAKDNIRRVTAALGVDHVFGSTPDMNEIFVDSLQRHANVCNGCFKTIYTLSMKLAQEEGIPLIVTGLSRGQFFETRLNEDMLLEPGITSEEIDARVLEARKAYHRVDDAPRRLLGVKIFDSDQIFDDVLFADFYRYCDVGLEEMLAYLGSRLPWVRPQDTGRSTNCLINDVGIYVHKRERGFHNYALPYSWDVRLGHKKREEALAELDDQIDVQRVEQILEEIGYPDDISTVGGGSKLVAYYTFHSEVSPAQIRAHVEAKLPAAMVPRQFVPIDEIPLTAHGKADRAALPNPTGVRPETDTLFVAPRNRLEQTIARTWSEVLAIDDIGVEDNFFDMGGDSIMALQIVSRLRRSGVAVEIRDLFETLTIEGMARRGSFGALESGTAAPGPIPLSPMQRWHMETRREPGHLSQIVRVEVKTPVSIEHLELCLAALVRRHPALRQRFRRSDGGWESELLDEAPLPHLIRVDGIPTADARLGYPFDITEPPLMRVVTHMSGSDVQAIDFEANHLVIDAVSWTVVVDDLNQLLGQIAHGESPAIPGNGASLRLWLDRLGERAIQVDPSTLPIAGPGPLPSTASGGSGRRIFTSEVDAATSELLEKADNRETRIDQMLIAAIALSLPAEWVFAGTRLFVEGHGRLADDVDLSREIGWFTTLTPLVLPGIAEETDLPNALASIKQSLDRRTRLADYGAIRYLHPSPETRAAVAVDFSREIVFNYLGDMGAVSSSAPLALDSRPVLGMPADESPVFGLEVNALIEHGHLLVEWTIAEMSPIAAAVEAAASALTSNLVAVCQAAQAEIPTAADFPLAGLDEEGLAKLTEVLGRLQP